MEVGGGGRSLDTPLSLLVARERDSQGEQKGQGSRLHRHLPRLRHFLKASIREGASSLPSALSDFILFLDKAVFIAQAIPSQEKSCLSPVSVGQACF